MNNRKRGFISAIVSIIVSLVLLGHFNIDLKEVFAKQTVQKNLMYGWELAVAGIGNIKDMIIK